MNNLILLGLLLTAGMAFAHDDSLDPKHNAIHHSYIGKICHAHTFGNDTVQGDFHDHENSYQFSDDSHNQKLSDYYLKLHDTNNPDNFNERGELYFDHGLHTPDYVVTPPVQSNGNPKSVESTPDVVAPVVKPSYNTHIPKPLRITYLAYSDKTLTLQITAPAPATHNYLVIRVDGQVFHTPALFFGGYRFAEGDMREVSLTAHVNGKSVILARMPYIQVSNGKAYPQVERTAGHAYGWLAIAAFDITDFTVQLRNYASEVDRDSVTQADFDDDGNRIGTVATAPNLRKPKLTTMWAELKKR